ncbi:MAG: hypothetical protein AB7E31_16450 [Desulfitobacterium sp.]
MLKQIWLRPIRIIQLRYGDLLKQLKPMILHPIGKYTNGIA